MTLYELLESMIDKIRTNNSKINTNLVESKSYTDTEIARLEEQISILNTTIQNNFESVYPVGSIYINVNNINPFDVFGFGTWTQIKDTFLLAAGDTYSNGEIGGEATHLLTDSEMPSHHHYPTTKTVNTTDSTSGYDFMMIRDMTSGSTARIQVAAGEDYWTIGVNPNATDFVSKNDISSSGHTTSAGEDQAHNNMPPYLAVSVWQRIS